MKSPTEYFRDLYQNSTQAVFVYDEEQTPLCCNAAAKALMARLGCRDRYALLTNAVKRVWLQCFEEHCGEAIPERIGEEELVLFLMPQFYDMRVFMVLRCEERAATPEAKLQEKWFNALRAKVQNQVTEANLLLDTAAMEEKARSGLKRELYGMVRIFNHFANALSRGREERILLPMHAGSFSESFVRHSADLLGEGRLALFIGEEHLFAMMDPDDIALILSTMLHNACRFGADRVRLIVRRSGDMIEFSMMDNGIGVSEPSRLFEPGYATPDKNGRSGMGYSLVMAQQLLRQQGGSIRYEQIDGETAFHILLPAAKEDVPSKLAEWRPDSSENPFSALRIEMSDLL